MTNTDKIIDINHNQQVATKLNELLDQSYSTLLTTQNLHWNVEGPNFYSVHKLTEEIYDEQFAAIDDIAERIRTLGHKVYVNSPKSDNDPNEVTIQDVIEAQEESVQKAQNVIEAAEEIGDEGTVDLAIARQQTHQKFAWMLKSQAK